MLEPYLAPECVSVSRCSASIVRNCERREDTQRWQADALRPQEIRGGARVGAKPDRVVLVFRRGAS